MNIDKLKLKEFSCLAVKPEAKGERRKAKSGLVKARFFALVPTRRVTAIKLRDTLVPKLPLGNPVKALGNCSLRCSTFCILAVVALRAGKLELPVLNSQAGAWELERRRGSFFLNLMAVTRRMEMRPSPILNYVERRTAPQVTASVLRIRDTARPTLHSHAARGNEEEFTHLVIKRETKGERRKAKSGLVKARFFSPFALRLSPFSYFICIDLWLNSYKLWSGSES